MQEYQQKLIEYMIHNQILKFGKFMLKTGRVSPYFLNIGLFKTGYDLTFLGQVYAQALSNSGIIFDVLFGLAYKGISIALTTTLVLAKYYQLNVSYCFNRKEAKDHGEGGILIGSHLHGNKVMIVDDVITTGTSINDSIAIITANHAKLAGITILLDRQEKGHNGISAIQQVQQDHDCKVSAIFALTDLITYLKEKNNMPEYLTAILAYQKQYGINS